MSTFRIRVYEKRLQTQVFISNDAGEGFTIYKMHEKWEFSHFWNHREELLETDDISLEELKDFIDLNELLGLL